MAITSMVPSINAATAALVAGFAHRRINADDAAAAGVIFCREHEIMRTGFAADIHARALASARAQFRGRRDVQHMRAGPVHSARMAARLTASIATTQDGRRYVRAVRPPAGRNLPRAAPSRNWSRHAANALPVGATLKASSMAVVGVGMRRTCFHIEFEADDAASINSRTRAIELSLAPHKARNRRALFGRDRCFAASARRSPPSEAYWAY